MASSPSKLARPGDPLVLPDGRVLKDPKARAAETRALVPAFAASDYKASRQRSIKDLPGSPGVMNAVAAVMVYTILGISDREISDILRITPDQVREVKKHTAYSDTFEVVKAEFINENSELLQSRIAAYSHAALDTVANLMAEGEMDAIKLRAAQDILDRGGARPADMAAKK